MAMLLLVFLLAAPFLQLTNAQCNFVGDSDREYVIQDDKPALEVPVSSDVVGFYQGIPGDNDVTKYFDIEVANSMLRFISKPTLANYFSEASGPVVMNRIVLRCAAQNETFPNMQITVNDTNNQPSKFDRETETYTIKLPYSQGAPINWESYVKITDEDLDEANTYVDLKINDTSYVDFFRHVERVPPDVAQRLDYYKVYFKLVGNAAIENHVVTLTATDKALKEVNFTMQLSVTSDDDVTSPVIETNTAFKLNNTINSAAVIASAVDGVSDFDLKIELDFTGLPSNFTNNFEVSFNASNGDIHLRVKEKIKLEDLQNNNFLVRMTLRVTDLAGNRATAPIAILFAPLSPVTVEGDPFIKTLTKGGKQDFEALFLNNPSEMAVLFTIAPAGVTPRNSIGASEEYLTINDTTGVITYDRSDDDIIANQGKTDIFIVTVKNKATSQDIIKVPIMILNEPDDSILPTTTEESSTATSDATTEDITSSSSTATSDATTEDITSSSSTETSKSTESTSTDSSSTADGVTSESSTSFDSTLCPVTTVETCTCPSPSFTTPVECSTPTQPIDPSTNTVVTSGATDPCDCTATTFTSTSTDTDNTNSSPASAVTSTDADTTLPCDCSSCSTTPISIPDCSTTPPTSGASSSTECPTSPEPTPCDCSTNNPASSPSTVTPDGSDPLCSTPIVLTTPTPVAGVEKCQKTGLIAGVAVASVIAVVSTAIAVYLIYILKPWSPSLKNVSKADSVPAKKGDPEIGHESYKSYPDSMQGNGSVTSARIGNGGYSEGIANIKASIPVVTSGIASVPRGSIIDGDGGARNRHVEAPVLEGVSAFSGPKGASPLSVDPILTVEPMGLETGSPTYSDNLINLTGEQEPEHDYEKSEPTYAEPNSIAGSNVANDTYGSDLFPTPAQSSVPIPPDAEVIEEPKVDYNRVTFGNAVEIIPSDAED